MYSVSLNPNRKENLDLIAEYNITPDKRKKILLDMNADLVNFIGMMIRLARFFMLKRIEKFTCCVI